MGERASFNQSGAQSTCGYPLKLEPQFVERVWGAESLEPIYKAHPGAPQRIGEVWLTGDSNRIENGAHAGQTLQALTRSCGAALLGEATSVDHPSGVPVFPLLVKFLFTTDKLSVQVHPANSGAVKHNSWGKTEMWHILRAEPGARLAVGFRSDVPSELCSRAERLREAAETGAIEPMLDWQEVCAGETYFVPAGTVHAIGAGITLCEIQQNSDITYRLYDYNRPGTDGKPRTLHVEQALEVIGGEVRGGKTAPVSRPGGRASRYVIAACPYFVTERWAFRSGASEEPRLDYRGGRMEVWIALSGETEFEAGGESVTVRQGEVVILPADAPTYRIQPDTDAQLLRTYPPDQETAEDLGAADLSLEELSKLCLPQSSRKGTSRGIAR